MKETRKVVASGKPKEGGCHIGKGKEEGGRKKQCMNRRRDEGVGAEKSEGGEGERRRGGGRGGIDSFYNS